MGRLAFLIFFFGLTLLPGSVMLSGAGPVAPVDENRRLAEPVKGDTPLDAVPRVADRWFSDHFGLRSLLIRLKTQIDFSVFGMSDRVLVGRGDQLFYRSTVNVEEPAMELALAAKETPALAGIARLTQALKAAGIEDAFVVPLMSDRFYPELLPKAAAHRPRQPRIDDFIARLRTLPDMNYIDSEMLLRRAMASRRIFHLTDFHWNDPAAFDVGKALVDRISAVEGRPTSAWTHPLRIQTKRMSGGIAMFMPLFKPPAENALMVEQSWDWPPGFSQSANQGLFEYSTSSTDKGLLPPTVFVGDSFLDGIQRSGLVADFVKTHRVRWAPGLKVSAIVANLPDDTRWLVFEFIEISQTAVDAFADADDIDKAVELLLTRQRAAANK